MVSRIDCKASMSTTFFVMRLLASCKFSCVNEYQMCLRCAIAHFTKSLIMDIRRACLLTMCNHISLLAWILSHKDLTLQCTQSHKLHIDVILWHQNASNIKGRRACLLTMCNHISLLAWIFPHKDLTLQCTQSQATYWRYIMTSKCVKYKGHVLTLVEILFSPQWHKFDVHVSSWNQNLSNVNLWDEGLIQDEFHFFHAEHIVQCSDDIKRRQHS